MALAHRKWIRVAAVLWLTALFSSSPRLFAQSGPVVQLTPEAAVALALDNNLALARDRFGPEIADMTVREAMAAWTPELSVGLAGARAVEPSRSAFETAQSSLINREVSSNLAWSQRLPWGSTYSVGWSGARYSSNSTFVRFAPELQAGATATFVQPLLRGVRFDAARAARDTSRAGRDIAGADLAASVAGTKRGVLQAYWLWVHANEVLAVHRDSLALAQALLDGNRARVAAGAMAAVDVIEAEAEVARRSESIVIASKAVANAEDLVRMLIFAPGDQRYDADLEPSVTEPLLPDRGVEAVRQALGRRQDLAALRVSIGIADIESRRSRDDLLPDASVRVDYTARGAGGTELLRDQGFTGPVTGSTARSFGATLDDLVRARYPTWSVGLAVSYPIGSSAAEATAARAEVARRQQAAAFAAAEQAAATEIRAALRETTANSDRLPLAATAVSLAERRLEAEQRKFTVGLSTSFFVFQAQRDLAASREAALRAQLDYRLSIADAEAVQVIPIATVIR